MGYDPKNIIYIGDKESGYKLDLDDRKTLRELFNLIETDKSVNCVLVWEVSRIARKPSISFQVRDFLQKNKVQLQIVNPEIICFNPSTFDVNDTASMMFAIYAATAEQERNMMLARLNRARDILREQGKYVGGGSYPIGFKITPDKYVVIDEESSKIVYNAFKFYAEGQSITFVYDYMKEMGYQRTRTGIHQMLTNKIYIGKIVSQELFDKVQENKKLRQNVGKQKRYDLASGLIVCPECGCHYSNLQGSWVCINHTHIYKNTNRYCTFNATLPEKYVEDVLWRVTTLEEVWFLLRDSELRRKEMTEELELIPRQIKTLEQSLNGFDDKIGRITDLYIDGRIDKVKMDVKIKEIEKDKKEKTERLEHLRQQEISLKSQLSGEFESDTDMIINNTSDAYIHLEQMDKVERYKLSHRWVKRCDVIRYEDYKVLTVHTSNNHTYQYLFKGIGRYGFHYYEYKHPNGKSCLDDWNDDYLEELKY